MPAVRDGRTGSEASIHMVISLVWRRRDRGSFPHNFAGLLVEAEHFETLLGLRTRVAGVPKGPFFSRPARPSHAGWIDGNRGRQEDLVAPEHWRRMPAA